MFFDSIKKLLGLDPNDRALQKYGSLVEIVNSYSESIHAKSDSEIKSRFQELKAQVQTPRSFCHRPRSQRSYYRPPSL